MKNIRALASSNATTDLDTRAIVRELKSYEEGQDDAVISALSRLLQNPHTDQISGLSDGLVHLIKLGRPNLTAAACDALTELWTHALAPLSGAERQRAARASRTLDDAEPHHRIVWALASDAPETFRALAPRITPDKWTEHVAPTLRRLPQDALHCALVALHEEAPEPIRTISLGLLDEGSDPAILEPLASSLPDSSSDYLTALARALGRVNRVEAEPILLSILSSYSRAEPEDLAALEALEKLGTAVSIPVLRDLAKSSMPGTAYRRWVNDTIEAITQRIDASQQGALSLASPHPNQGGLSLSTSGAEGGDMSLYENVWRKTVSMGHPTNDHTTQHVDIGRSLSFWITWPVYNSTFSYLITLVLFVSPTVMVLTHINQDDPAALLSTGLPESFHGPILIAYGLGAVILLVNAYAQLKAWRRRGWFELLAQPQLVLVSATWMPAPRLARFNRPKLLKLSWVDAHGTPVMEQRDPANTFERTTLPSPQRETVTLKALTRNSSAFIPGRDTPFLLNDHHELTLSPWFHFVFWYALLFTLLNLYLLTIHP